MRIADAFARVLESRHLNIGDASFGFFAKESDELVFCRVIGNS